jgi:hypothetical protein
MSIDAKDLRDIVDDAMKRASHVFSDAKIPDKLPDLVRRDTTPGLVYFSLGLLFGALAGVVIAFLATPVNGEQARQKLQEKLDDLRSQHEQREGFEPHPVSPTNGSIPA